MIIEDFNTFLQADIKSMNILKNMNHIISKLGLRYIIHCTQQLQNTYSFEICGGYLPK